MVINLWYNKAMQEWRWTLTETKMLEQHSGNRKELREAMNDVASTVEYILEEKCEE
tara:strand:- start:148 stop:315 length:168 start_codon:yes stop_codon:yes gene_type:complete